MQAIYRHKQTGELIEAGQIHLSTGIKYLRWTSEKILEAMDKKEFEVSYEYVPECERNIQEPDYEIDGDETPE